MTSCLLHVYRREFTPDLEVAPREPAHAVELVSGSGVPFTLVREAPSAPCPGRDLAWLIWRGTACVGYVGGNVLPHDWDPFAAPRAPYNAGGRLHPRWAFALWRAHLADGTECGPAVGRGRASLAPLPSQRLGIMTVALADIIRQLSSVGALLRSDPEARSPAARAMWTRLTATPGIETVRWRAGTLRGLQFTVMRQPELTVRTGISAAR